MASGFSVAGETSRRHVTDTSVHETPNRFRLNGGLASTSQHPAAEIWSDSSPFVSRILNDKSPPPLANDRYQLQGGMESTGLPSRGAGNYDDYFQLEKQRAMWSGATSPSSGVPNQSSSHEAPQASPESKPWMLNQIISLVGGVAGSLVQFCSRPFRGFQSGGGQAYTFGADGGIVETEQQMTPFVFGGAGSAATRTSLPGGFPEDNYGVLSVESVENERPRMSKRIKTGETWVMVDQNGGTESRPSTPRVSERRVPAHVKSPSQVSLIPRPVSRASVNPNESTPPPRPSLIPVSRRSNAERRLSLGRSGLPSTPSSTPRTYLRQSYGSPALSRDTKQLKKSPLLPESQRLITKMRQEELEDEARLRRMSSQMAQMLKEAQAALGSNYTLEDDHMGEVG